ncbi:hypothetical protein SO802_024759 [Lithocarpus litseifolius]|uniref:Transposase MuDR plant domain-containing protein n=1 Tax=Lithocarpus litseifolius TaxID=425828 RepID=A0AAW2C9R9_9ROSI
MQAKRRVLATDEWLRVKGCENVYAIGDCATIDQRKVMTRLITPICPHHGECVSRILLNKNGFVVKVGWPVADSPNLTLKIVDKYLQDSIVLMRKLLQKQILGSKKANKKGAPVTTLSEDNRLVGLIYVNEQFDGWKAKCLRILQSKFDNKTCTVASDGEIMESLNNSSVGQAANSKQTQKLYSLSPTTESVLLVVQQPLLGYFLASMLVNRSAMDFHFFYVYYDGETYYHDLHGLSYQGSNQKQKCVKVKRGIGLMNLQRRILKAMRLDQSRHNISIVYRAPQLVVGTQVFYNSLQLSGGAEVKMMWEVVEKMGVKGFVASELYVTVVSAIVEAGEGSQHTVLDGTVDEHVDSIPLQSYQGCTENTGDGYGSEPWQIFPHLHWGTSKNEDDHGLGDDATHIDFTRDDFKEFLDTMGDHEDVDHIEDVVVEENRDTCPPPDPMLKWFTKNTWDNMFDPSPVMQVEVSSSTPGEQPMKGMVFATKLAVRHALTWYALQENFSFKTEHSDSERLMVSCEDDSCPWSVRAICCKGDNVWNIAKCKGLHTCDKIQNAHDDRMIDSAFLAYVLESYIQEDPAYKIKNLCHVALADLKHEVSHYKAFRPCIVGFKHCRPVISIDATHLYGKYRGNLMIAMETDANNKIYPLAFAVVESESTKTWGWFLACIRRLVFQGKTVLWIK